MAQSSQCSHSFRLSEMIMIAIICMSCWFLQTYSHDASSKYIVEFPHLFVVSNNFVCRDFALYWHFSYEKNPMKNSRIRPKLNSSFFFCRGVFLYGSFLVQILSKTPFLFLFPQSQILYINIQKFPRKSMDIYISIYLSARRRRRRSGRWYSYEKFSNFLYFWILICSCSIMWWCIRTWESKFTYINHHTKWKIFFFFLCHR